MGGGWDSACGHVEEGGSLTDRTGDHNNELSKRGKKGEQKSRRKLSVKDRKRRKLVFPERGGDRLIEIFRGYRRERKMEGTTSCSPQ